MPVRLLLVLLVACTNTPPDDMLGPDAQRPDTGANPDAPADATVSDGCVADSACASGACREATGECVPETQVLFVAPSGSDTGTCTRATPCATIAHAATLLSSSRDTIALAAGTYAGTFAIATAAVLSGPSRDPSAAVLNAPNRNAIIARFDTAAIAVETLTIGGNTVTDAPQAVSIHNGAHVSFDRVTVRDNYRTGVFVSDSTLDVMRYEALANDYGILANETSTITVERSYVHDNKFAGLAAAGSYRIVNTVLAKNSIGFIPFGGSNTGTLDFVTFAAQTSTVISSTHAITASNSIFANNMTPPSAPVSITYSLFTSAPPAGTGNVMGDPMFVATGDYHIGPSSAAIDRASPAATIATDIDGDPRPAGAARDIGADERP